MANPGGTEEIGADLRRDTQTVSASGDGLCAGGDGAGTRAVGTDARSSPRACRPRGRGSGRGVVGERRVQVPPPSSGSSGAANPAPAIATPSSMTLDCRVHTRASAQSVFSQVDKDGSGTIDRAEFEQWYTGQRRKAALIIDHGHLQHPPGKDFLGEYVDKVPVRPHPCAPVLLESSPRVCGLSPCVSARVQRFAKERANVSIGHDAHVCVCLCAVRACVRACARACVRACMCACVRACGARAVHACVRARHT